MSDYLALYRQYLQSINPALDGEFLIAENLSTNWDEPETALDFHNCAVMALIEAENSPMRSMYVEMAFQSLQRVLEMAVYPDRGTSKLKSLCSMEYRHRLPKKISNI
jgi:hypothetical protein